MKKLISLLFIVMMTLTASAQSDYTYLDAVKVLTENATLRALGEKGYVMRKEAKGATHDLYYTKGQMFLGEDFEWHGKDNNSSLVRVTYLNNEIHSIDIIYTSLMSIEASADEITHSKATPIGTTQEGTSKIFKFQTDKLYVTLEIPESHETATVHVEKR